MVFWWMVAANIANLDKHSFKGNQSVTANLQEVTRAPTPTDEEFLPTVRETPGM